MPVSATVTIHCSERGCLVSAALICAVIPPQGWGESLPEGVPGTLFWCPAHAAARCHPTWISRGRP